MSIEPIPGLYLKEAQEDWLRTPLTVEKQICQTAPGNMRDITLLTI